MRNKIVNQKVKLNRKHVQCTIERRLEKLMDGCLPPILVLNNKIQVTSLFERPRQHPGHFCY